MPLRAVTFDVYAALFDTVTGLAEVLADFLRRRGVHADPREIAGVWRRKHAEYLLLANALDVEPASNRPAIGAGLRYALRRVVRDLTDAETAGLTSAWERLPPWPEAVRVLREVRRKPLVIAALSNGDEDMLRALLATLAVAFDHVVSTQGGRFKPDRSIYQKALRTLALPADEVLHVAGSPTDAIGATAAGLRTLWINRAGDAVLDARFAPRHEAPDLTGVLPLLDTG